MSIKEVEQQIVEEFSVFTDWLDKYEYLIDLGRSLPIINLKAKQSESKTVLLLNVSFKRTRTSTVIRSRPSTPVI